MEIFYARDYGITPGCEVASELNELFKKLKSVKGEKKLIFEKGEYKILRQNCPYIYRAITNTTAASEYRNPKDAFMHYVAFLIEDVEDLEIDGCGSLFTIDGKVTNAVISGCKNLQFKNIRIDTKNPNLHKLTVRSKGLFSVDFELDSESEYINENGTLSWVGNGFKRGFTENAMNSWWIAVIEPKTPEKVVRTGHPFMCALSVKETSPYKFRARYPITARFKKGQEFYVFDVHRSDVGIFVEKSSDISLSGVEQYFNYSLALVLQDCEDVTLDSCRFAPKKGSERHLSSIADFIQVCMCSGKISVTNCFFDGAGDDAINVHGIHYPIKDISGNECTAVFSHSQSWGFNPLHAGDRVEFTDPKTMLCVGENKIVSAELIGTHEIRVKMEKEIPASLASAVIEDIDRCPELYYANNTATRIITRGILYTSRGKCVIENNRFVSTSMSGVLLSDDAKSWYESGPCRDVTVRNNEFLYCGGAPVLILPENSVHKGAVHKNILIEGNKFCKHVGPYVKVKSASNVVIKNNCYSGKDVQITNSEVVCENNSKI